MRKRDINPVSKLRLFLRLVQACGLGFGVLLPACQEEPGPIVEPQALDLPSRLQTGLQYALSPTSDPGGLLATTLPDQTFWAGATGASSLVPYAPMRSDQLFKIGSITKTFTAAAILVLAEEGALSLDDTLDEWVPGYFANDDEITIHHLLTHTSGIYSYTDAQEVIPRNNQTMTIEEVMEHLQRAWTPEELVAIAASYNPLFAPGTRFSYCNTGFILLGIIAGRASGSTWEDVVQDRLLDPLDLDQTYFDWIGAPADELARGYYWDGTKQIDVTDHDPSWAWSAGSMVSTARDLRRWSQALYGGEILNDSSLEALTTPWVVLDEPTGISYGLGTVVWETASGTLYWHTGGMFGYKAYMGSIPEHDTRVVAMVNSHGGDVYAVANVAWRVVLGQPLH